MNSITEPTDDIRRNSDRVVRNIAVTIWNINSMASDRVIQSEVDSLAKAIRRPVVIIQATHRVYEMNAMRSRIPMCRWRE